MVQFFKNAACIRISQLLAPIFLSDSSITWCEHLLNDLLKSRAVNTTDLFAIDLSRPRKILSHASIITWSVEDPLNPPCWFDFQLFDVSNRVRSAITGPRPSSKVGL